MANNSRKLSIILIALVILYLLTACTFSVLKDRYSYNFKNGSILRLNFPEDFKPVFPELSISNGKDKKTLILPLGTIIWKDKKDEGMLIVKYMDKRFAAYASYAYSLISLNTFDITTVASDVIYEVNTESDDYLIGVQRIPIDTDYLDNLDDTDYNNSLQLLFVIKIDYKQHNFQRLNILSGTSLPDNNQLSSEEETGSIENNFYVNDGILYYKKGEKIRKLILSDFNNISNYRGINVLH